MTKVTTFVGDARVARLGGHRAHREQRRVGEEPAALRAAEPLAGENLLSNLLDHDRLTPRPSRSQTRTHVVARRAPPESRRRRG